MTRRKKSMRGISTKPVNEFDCGTIIKPNSSLRVLAMTKGVILVCRRSYARGDGALTPGAIKQRRKLKRLLDNKKSSK